MACSKAARCTPRSSNCDWTAIQLRLSLSNVQVGVNSGVEPVLRQREVFFVGCLGACKQLRFSVVTVQTEIILRQFGLVEQPGISHVGRQRLGSRGARRHTAADVSPQIRLPRDIERQTEAFSAARVAPVVPADTFDPRRRWSPDRWLAVGNKAARATLTAALASRYCASAWSTFWLETLTCSSSAFNAGSLYSSHHRPFEYASPGCDCFHPAASASLKFTGGCSLNAGGVAAGGRL